ncbi:MAG TPA: phosphatidylglycerophosphatase A [Pyrinomonadaceae bacterium]|nr:phosphatidylglycerophosphatase A [Pyrinomonadaceae bacterium]
MSAIKESSDELNPSITVLANEISTRKQRTASDYFALAIATCGVGYFPIAPGTLGSLVGVLLFLAIRRLTRVLLVPYSFKHQINFFTLQSIESAVMLVVILVVTLGGIWAASRSESLFRKKDPGEVVIDEVSGQMIALLSTSLLIGGVWAVISAFILFRAFDIWKPYPIRRLEALESGLGIMLDDVAAGLYAAIVNTILIAVVGIFFLR